MAIDWLNYDRFDWQKSQQHPMDPAARATVEDLVADLLGLSAGDRAGLLWGQASPPGRFAATVVRILPGVSHPYQAQATTAGIGSVGVKVFKSNSDALREARRVVPFHVTQFYRLPGLPNNRMQQSLEAGYRLGLDGAERAFVILEWVPGESLEDLIRRHWPTTPVSAEVARSVLAQLLGDIIIPLWAAGTIWWDIRDANYCYSPQSGRLTLIDLDSLAAYADEILQTPQVWTRRDKGQATALARLRQLCIRVLLAQGGSNRKRITATFSQLWESELEPVLSTLGKPGQQKAVAVTALERFLDQLEAHHCFG